MLAPSPAVPPPLPPLEEPPPPVPPPPATGLLLPQAPRIREKANTNGMTPERPMRCDMIFPLACAPWARFVLMCFTIA